MSQSTRQWLLQHKPASLPVLDGPDATFRLTSTDLPAPKDDQVLLKVLYLSNDPAMRAWINPTADRERMYIPPVEEGDVMRCFALAEVMESRSESLSRGSFVTGTFGWTEYAVRDAKDCNLVQEIEGVSVTHFLGVFGFTGLTAYFGLTEVVKAGPEDAVVVSGAAGATGSMVVQIAKKMLGCKKVIGIAGSDEKCKWVESLGADACLNYKAKSFEDDLKAATSGFVEVYFDNVGGEILDLMLTRMKRHGRVAACGAISQYNSESRGLKNYGQIITNRLELKGFIVLDYLKDAQAATHEIIKALKEGKIQVSEKNETVVDTSFEKIPETWMKLFSGENVGKLVTKLI